MGYDIGGTRGFRSGQTLVNKNPRPKIWVSTKKLIKAWGGGKLICRRNRRSNIDKLWDEADRSNESMTFYKAQSPGALHINNDLPTDFKAPVKTTNTRRFKSNLIISHSCPPNSKILDQVQNTHHLIFIPLNTPGPFEQKTCGKQLVPHPRRTGPLFASYANLAHE